MKREAMKIERGSGNVFADLGHPNAEAHLLKAELVARIDKIIRQRGLNRSRRRSCSDCPNLTFRASCGEAFGSILLSGSYAC